MKKKFHLKDSTWNILTVLVLAGALGLAAAVLIVFVNPYSALNPLPPGGLPDRLVLPTATITLLALPATWTITPDPATATPTITDTPTDTPTPEPTFTPTPTDTPTATPTIRIFQRTATRTPTRSPTPTLTPWLPTAVPPTYTPVPPTSTTVTPAATEIIVPTAPSIGP